MTGDKLYGDTSDRGFDFHLPVPSEYGGGVSVSESSAAMGPHVWVRATAPINLNDPAGPSHEAPAHLTGENAWLLARQIAATVVHHYQGDARPDAVIDADREILAEILRGGIRPDTLLRDLAERGLVLINVGRPQQPTPDTEGDPK